MELVVPPVAASAGVRRAMIDRTFQGPYTRIGVTARPVQNSTLGPDKITKRKKLSGRALGMELAAIAANENTPLLLLSGQSEADDKLEEPNYPDLANPFSLDRLLAESKQVVAEARENIRRAKASAVRMRASAEALRATLTELRQLLSRIERDTRTR
jgi:hypothetical protein